MPLIDTLPEGLETELKPIREAGALEVAVSTDMTLDGKFGEEWLVVTTDLLRVYTADGTVRSRLEIPLQKLKSAAGDALIGGGALIVVVDGRTEEVVRYTNAHQKKFGRVTKYLSDLVAHLEALSTGKEAKARPRVDPDPEDRKRCPDCGFLLPEGTKVCPACLKKSKVVLRLVAYLKPYWKRVIFVWVAMFAGLVLSLIPPYLTRPLVDRVLVPREDIATVQERLALLGWLVLGLLLAQGIGQVIGILRARTLVKLGTQISHDLRVQLYSHLQFLSLRFFDKRPIGGMITRVMQDTRSLEEVLVDGTQYLVINILTLVGIGVVLFVMNWKLAILVLVPVPIVIVLSRRFWRKILSLWHRYWHYRSRLTGSVSDTLSGVRVVKAFAKEQEESERFRAHSEDLRVSDTAAEQTWTTLFPMLWFIASTGSLMVWYVGGRQVVGGSITLGTLMTFLAYLGMFYGPLQFLSRVADYLARSLTSAERVFEILDSVPEIKEAENPVPLPRIEGRVEFKNVTFGYEPHRPVIKNFAVDVKPGEMIGLVGHSGAGKTTTANLLCRFYDVLEGELLIDGMNVKSVRQQDLRSQIGVVLQDTFLFNGTIAENIAYARPGASLEDVMAAAKTANAHDFIVGKADGYDTKVGERGQSLSGGERQRIAIARAILHDPRLLILDEATASVDTDTEKQIQEAIGRLIKGRTTFAIAHRLSTLRHANRLIVLKDGEIVEIGTHEELLAKKGEFHRLVEMQKEVSSMVEVVG